MYRLPLFILFIATLLLTSFDAGARGRRRDIKSVRQEQKEVKDAVRQTDRAITNNTRETERKLNILNALGRKVDESRRAISLSEAGIDSLDRAITVHTDSLNALTARLEAIRKDYAASLRRQQLYPDVNSPLAFIFSASSVGDAYRRMRYLRQYDRWRSRRTAELSSAVEAVEAAKKRLEASRTSRAEALTRLRRQRDDLAREQAQTDSIVAALRKEGNNLRAVLAEKQRQADALDRELDRLIAEEQARIERERKAAEERRRKEEAERKAREKAEREAKAAKEKTAQDNAKSQGNDADAKEKPEAKPKPATPKPKATLDSEAEADRKLTGSFAANKGRLLFPVAGRYRIVRGFGLQKHPELAHVKTNNSGIDIEVAPGTDARAIFNGKVSAIFRLPGYATIVMVRHGDYISLYANLASTYVKKGDTVKTGQAIGRILTGSDDDGGATTFHFELRRERAKLNPLEWVK